MGFQTDCASSGDERQRFYGSVAPPLFQSSLFTFDTYEAFADAFVPANEGAGDNFVYTRTSNPTVQILERKVALLERAPAARAVASGMAAIAAAVLSTAHSGDHILAPHSLYSNAYRLFSGYFPKLGIETSFVDCTSVEKISEAIRPTTRVLYLESPANPAMHVIDLLAVSALARDRSITTVLDNTMATPYNQRPIEADVDIVVHSASKYLSGHADLIAGVLAGSAERMRSISANEVRDLGGCLGPFDAWLLLRGIRTLGVRMETHNRNGMAVALWLENHPEVLRVFYPGLKSHPQHSLASRQMSGFSGLLSVVVAGGQQRAAKFVNRLRHFGIGVSWGGFESLALPIEPGSYLTADVARDLGVVPGFVRLSIGLEDVDDLLCDLDRALKETSRG